MYGEFDHLFGVEPLMFHMMILLGLALEEQGVRCFTAEKCNWQKVEQNES